VSLHYIASLGDSLTYPTALGVSPEVMWPNVLSQKLNALGCTTVSQNSGRSGITSTTLLTMMGWAVRGGGTCDLATVWIGANDPGNSIATATTLLNIQCVVRALKYGCFNKVTQAAQIVASQTNLPAGPGVHVGDRYVVQVDTDSTGGVAASDASQLPTITGAGNSDITVWEYRGGLAGIYGWGRVAKTSTSTLATAPFCQKILIVSMHYQNFTSNGDTLSTPWATYATIRTGAQIPAATAEGVPYVDLYNFMRNRIVNGVDYDQTGGLNLARDWHVADQNQHLNQYGNEIVAECVLQAIQSQTGWISALSV
jgi:lysophospholipase L1-like esterase